MRNKIVLIVVFALMILLPMAMTQPSRKVSFMLEFNINGIEYDSAEVDGNGEGIYYTDDIENHYACIEDTATAFGIAGRSADYINLSRPGNYSIKFSQEYEGNKFIIPLTTSCETIRKGMLSVRSGVFDSPFAGFIARQNDFTHIILNYSDVTGEFSKSGLFILTMEKNNSQITVRGR